MAATITDDIVATVLESIEEKSYEDEKEKAGMIKDEANQFFKGIFWKKTDFLMNFKVFSCCRSSVRRGRRPLLCRN